MYHGREEEKKEWVKAPGKDEEKFVNKEEEKTEQKEEEKDWAGVLGGGGR